MMVAFLQMALHALAYFVPPAGFAAFALALARVQRNLRDSLPTGAELGPPWARRLVQLTKVVLAAVAVALTALAAACARLLFLSSG